MWLASNDSGAGVIIRFTKVGNSPMSEFQEWARLTFSRSGIEVGDDELGLVELVYVSALGQLDALNHIDLEKCPALGMDLRHAPKSS